MGVSLAKEPYVAPDARPSYHLRMAAVASLLHLQAVVERGASSMGAGTALVDSARIAAPALLDLLSLGRDDLDAFAPLEDTKRLDIRFELLKTRIPALIEMLQRPDPCPTHRFEPTVRGVAVQLRQALHIVHRRFWLERGMAAAFADRVWDREQPRGLAGVGSAIADVLGCVVSGIIAVIGWPIFMAMSWDRATKSALPAPRKDATLPPARTPPGDPMQAIRLALGFLPVVHARVLDEVDASRKRLLDHARRHPADGDRIKRVEAHLADLARRATAATENRSLQDELRDGVIVALDALRQTMDDICEAAYQLTADALSTEIRFIVSAHGTEDAVLNLPPGRMVA